MRVDAIRQDARKRRRSWEGVLVLNYHRIGDGERLVSDRGIWSATAEEFAAQIGFLARHFSVVGAHQLRDGVPERPGRYVAVTIDDGYREGFDVAYPILAAHGVPATFFLATGYIDGTHLAWWDEIAWMVRESPRNTVGTGRWSGTPLSLAAADRRQTAQALIDQYKALPGDRTEGFLDELGKATATGRRDHADARADWITWEMARSLHRGGMGIGGHTVSHPILGGLSRADQQREIATCLDRLEEELGQRPTAFSYPVGLRTSFNMDTEECLRASGVEVAFSNYGGVARRGGWNPYDVPRTCIASVLHQRFRALTTAPLLFIDVERRRALRGLCGRTL
jgi:peptidoglycan/xylan/chitin deacetylase (PgdA/CDA1 family)